MIRQLVLGVVIFLLCSCGGEGENEPTASSRTKKKSAQAADLIQFSGRPGVIEAGGRRVKVYPRATVGVGQGYDLSLTGAGVRVKKVLIASVDVYVGAHYMVDPGFRGSSNNPMAAIARSPVEAVVMTMVRDVTASQIRDAFQETLKVNKIDPNGPMMRPLFNSLTFSVEAGMEIIFVSVAEGRGNEVIHVRSPVADKSFSGRDMGLTLWKVWFGNLHIDQELTELKYALMGASR